MIFKTYYSSSSYPLTSLITKSVGIPSRLVKNTLKDQKSNPSNLNNNAIINYKNLNISYYIYK
jgi:hypothetical protein